jgi:signal transduction histidine kinase
MSLPVKDICLTALETVTARSRIALCLVGPDGRIEWANRFAVEEFPGSFAKGKVYQSELEQCTRSQSEGLLGGAADEALSFGGDTRQATRARNADEMYRYSCVPLDEAGAGCTLHSLVNSSGEKKLKQHFIHSLQQLKSMREIVDMLYESLGAQEVIYLILVAVTSQIGFGFNRAFFLQAKGNRLRGRIGIGPSNHEEAHQIWSRIASLNFSSLREVYNDLTHNGGVPDPRTQETALHLDFDISALIGGRPEAATAAEFDPFPALLEVLQRGKPARLHAGGARSTMDRQLFQFLATDALAVVPLLVRGNLAGVILADNFINRKPIGEADLSLLKTFAGYAGVALERSHLFEELRESVTKLQSANENLKANQQKLLHAEKLSAIGELAAYVSHEIRNPLVAIGGLARSLLKDQVDTPETAETLEIIVSEVSRLEKFLRDTLDFVKPRTTRPVGVDLGVILKETLAPFRNELVRYGIEPELDLGKESVHCFLDPDLLRHAVSNLLKNAIEAMASGGRLYLGIERLSATVAIRVGDTGHGIPHEVQARIFDPFFTTKSDGTGLGLTLATQNVRSLGGQIEIEKNPAWKTLFKVTLPLDEGLNRNSHRSQAAEVLQGGRNENCSCSR